MKNFALTILALFLALLITHAQVLSDFESGDTDSWHSEGDGDYYWEAGTGNPGACFRVDDDATGDWNNAFAPVKFLGNWSAATTADYLTADVFLHPIATSYGSGIFVFQISGPGGEARAFVGSQPTFDTWTTYTAYLDPANWTMLSGDWILLMQQVNELIVRAEYIQGDEFNRLDNVGLSFTPVIIPVAPVLCSDFEAEGYDGWSFSSTGGVSNSTTGGNPGRCIKINDGSSISKAYPPPKYLGDWTQIDFHNADIRVDIKITGYSGTLLTNSYFIQISGAGGVAQIQLNESITLAYDRYKTFVFPIEESSWTMISGTWSDLMDHVNSCEILVEFIDGSETIWMDNFCISNLPPIAEFNATVYTEFPGNPIQFYDLSVQGPVSWNWDFDDGNLSPDQHPEHIFLTSGIYDIDLTVDNHFGSDNISKPGYIEILPIDQCLKHEDDFNDNSFSPMWKTKNGTWSESSEILRQTSNDYVNGNYLEGCFAIIGSPQWENYIVSCDFRSTDDDYIGFVFNYQDETNMYMFRWGLQTPERILSKYENGVETILASDEIGYIENDWYHADIYSIAGNLVVAIDGVEIFSVFDDTFLTGKAGPYCWGNLSSYYDNFRVECPGVQIDINVMLEGAFVGTEMQTILNSNALLPEINPYVATPWNYPKTDGVLNYTNADIVDWVLVDFRDATTANTATPGTSIETKAALLLKDGQVISPYGGMPLYLNKTINENLFVAIFHRNHLGILSASPLIESGDIYTYDFTSGSGQAYGTDAQKDLGNGNYGSYAGDLNADGVIDDLDKNLAWGVDAGSSGYLPSDSNLDGESDNLDKNDFWLGNQSKNGQIPE